MSWRKVIPFVLIFIYHLPSYGQMTDSLANYYFYINQAELLIAENNYLGANAKYQRASNFKSNWFGKDLYNYALLQIKLDDSKEANNTLLQLARKGFDFNLLNGLSSFSNYFETKKGKKFKNKLKEIEVIYNVDLRATYDSLYIIDSIANENYDWKNYNASISKIDSSNIERLDQLLKNSGFPTEDLVGIHGWFLYQPIVNLMIHHNRHTQIGRVIDFVGLVNQYGEAGLINNHKAAWLISNVSSHDQYNVGGTITKYVIKEDSNSVEKVTDSMYTYFINGYPEDLAIERQKLSLPTMMEEVKLAKFNWENETDFILGSASKQSHLIRTRRTFENLKKFRKQIEIVERY